MPNQTQLAVTFSLETVDSRTNQVTYWFDVKVPGYECTNICLGLSHTGEWTTASGSFFDLDTKMKTDALEMARKLLPKLIS